MKMGKGEFMQRCKSEEERQDGGVKGLKVN